MQPTHLHDRTRSYNAKNKKSIYRNNKERISYLTPPIQYCEEGESCCTLLWYVELPDAAAAPYNVLLPDF